MAKIQSRKLEQPQKSFLLCWWDFQGWDGAAVDHFQLKQTKKKYYICHKNSTTGSHKQVSPKLPVTAVRTSLSIWYLSLWSIGRIFSRTYRKRESRDGILTGREPNKRLCLLLCFDNDLTVLTVMILVKAWPSLIFCPSVFMLIRCVRSWR